MAVEDETLEKITNAAYLAMRLIAAGLIVFYASKVSQ
jgi:hypothetical protein